MEYQKIMKMLYEKYGSCYMNDEFYTKIKYWIDWYKGYVETIHKKRVSNGMQCFEEEVYRLEMAKRVCEDWTSAILADGVKITITAKNKQTENLVQGVKATSGVLGSNNFDNVLSTFLERVFAFGTGAMVADLENIGVDEAGNLVSVQNANIRIRTYDATCIIPLKYSNEVITDIAFISRTKTLNGEVTIITTHVLEADGYVIYNTAMKGGNTVMLNGLIPMFRTKSMYPLFHIVKTNISNNIDLDSPMGVSIYANATDILKAVDLAYDSCIRDTITGQRIILMNKKLLAMDEQGNPIAPQDARKSYIYFLGDEGASPDEKSNQFYQEFTPTLNTDKLDSELQNQLNMLSNKVGLGTRFYNFNISSGVTATEYVGERNDFIRNCNKMKLSIQNSVKNLVLSIIYLGGIIGKTVDPNAKIDVAIADGIIESDKEKREQDRQDVKDGLMSKAEYRAKWYGESLEEAEKKIEAISSNQSLI